MIHVVFNIDKNYIEHCKNVIRSIRENTKSAVTFHIIGAEIAGYNRYKAPDTSNLKVTHNPETLITESAVYRLYIPDLIKADKCIYLDSDIIVLDDIQKLWDIDIEYIGGVLDPMAKMQADKNNLKHGYINTGVLVLNLKNLRKLAYWERIYKAQETAKDLSLVDQDTLNIAFGDLIQHLPEKWNVYSDIYSQSTKEMIQARENPSIIHWCGFRKPWVTNVWQRKKWSKYMRAIVLTYAPVSKEEKELLRKTDLYKIATNFSAAELKPDIRLCADDIVDKCLECDTCPVVSCNYDLAKERVLNGCGLPKRHSTLLSCVDFLLSKGYNEILLVASNPVSATCKINYEGIEMLKDYAFLYKYTEDGNLNIPYKSIKDFIMLTDEERLLGITEKSPKKMMEAMIFTNASQFEVWTKGKDNKSIETGEIVKNILPADYREKILRGETELEYNNLCFKMLTTFKVQPEKAKEMEEEAKEEVKEEVKPKKPVKKAKKK